MSASRCAMPLDRACPLCGSGSGVPLHAQLFAPFGDDAPAGYTLVTCERCGFGFADLATTQGAVDHVYRDLSVPTERAVDLARLRGTAAFLAERLPPGARVLDAGCGTGALLEFLRDRGVTGAVGLDASAGAAASGVARGRDVRVGSLAAPPAELGSFDAIVLAHVLEHVVDLHGIVRAVRALLRPGGAVYAETPDASRYERYCFEPFHDVNSEHVNHFSLRALDALFARHGFAAGERARGLVECAPGMPYPVALGLWHLAPATAPVAEDTGFDAELAEALERYVALSSDGLRRVAARLREDLAGASAIAIWGAGEFVRRLAADTRFAGARVEAVVDSAPSLRGRAFLGARIAAPDTLTARPELPIVVGSVLHREAIASTIGERGWPNPVIRLERPGATPASSRSRVLR